jgi:hypothetical protein
MTSIRDPLLTVWEAMNLLEEVRICSDTPEISKALAVAEIVLVGLVAALVRRIEPMIPAGSVIIPFKSAVPRY